ncbi:Uncharacterized protein HZ326_11410 [Fusarium oxysporum f. sp. albedinis]|nr:Uncharacterized protein HZ326_11410 [Fusarium oxysporum f. sp. albedinis]
MKSSMGTNLLKGLATTLWRSGISIPAKLAVVKVAWRARSLKGRIRARLGKGKQSKKRSRRTKTKTNWMGRTVAPKKKTSSWTRPRKSYKSPLHAGATRSARWPMRTTTQTKKTSTWRPGFL